MTEQLETYRYADLKAFKEALQKGPAESWLMERSLGAGRTVEYTPIQIKEALADQMFREWTIVDEKYFNILNELICTVKIHATPDYPGAELWVFSGSASKQIACDSGSKVDQFPLGKKGNALQYNLPAVRSDAVGCALESLGNMFGRNTARSVANDFGFKFKEEESE